MKIPFLNEHGQITAILDSKDLTADEIKLVKANKSGALSAKDMYEAGMEPRP